MPNSATFNRLSSCILAVCYRYDWTIRQTVEGYMNFVEIEHEGRYPQSDEELTQSFESFMQWMKQGA
jgi:hypothetical protein